MSRFDYVKYDMYAAAEQASFKDAVIALERRVMDLPESAGRAKALAITKLEEFYMWVGKAIRDAQIERNGSAPLQEERGNE